jgi:hypothetical protein
MPVYNSNVFDVFTRGGRIRTLNHRGSLLSDVATVIPFNVTGNGQLALNDVLPLFPITYRCMIRGIYLAWSGEYNANMRLRLDLYGLKKDGKTLDNLIKEGIDATRISTQALPTAAVGLTLETPSVLAGQTLYQSLSENPNNTPWVPLPAFVPYKDDRLGVLALTVTTAATANVTAVSRLTVRVDYIESAPSDGPFIQKIGLTAQTA